VIGAGRVGGRVAQRKKSVANKLIDTYQLRLKQQAEPLRV